ncbi:MAG: hypothetical protein QXT27_01715 [Pyrobaculum sp.]
MVISTSEKEAVLQSLDGVYRQFFRAVLAFMATMEREFTRHRTKIAIERARKRGLIKNAAERYSHLIPTAVEMYKSGHSIGEISRALGLSMYEVRRLLSHAGVYRPTPTTCPRCFSKMKMVEKDVKVIDGRYVVVERFYCQNCGYEEVRR